MQNFVVSDTLFALATFTGRQQEKYLLTKPLKWKHLASAKLPYTKA